MNTPATEHWTQAPLPFFREDEVGQFLAPEYESENEPFPINPSEWTHIASCRFGEARQAGSMSKWTGDSYRYDIFRKGDGSGRRYALRWWNGSGQGWLLENSREYRDEKSTLDIIAGILDESIRWDMAHFLWGAATKSAAASARKTDRYFRQAIAEGRVKKKKVRGQSAYKIAVISPEEAEWRAARRQLGCEI